MPEDGDKAQINTLLLTRDQYCGVKLWSVSACLHIWDTLCGEEILEVSHELLIVELFAFEHIQHEARMDVQDVQNLL